MIAEALVHFADDNTLSAISVNRKEILTTLSEESKSAVNWFKENMMIVNPDKFQSMILDKKDKNNESLKLDICRYKIKTS